MAAGTVRPELRGLARVKDRLTFLYVEHCKVDRDASAVKILEPDGEASVPAAMLTVLMLGPGSRVSHRAMELLADCGVGSVWCGEHGVRYYAHGRALNAGTGMLLRQVEIVGNTRKHLECAKAMYGMRFPGEDLSGLTMQQLRGREGTRMKRLYKRMAVEHGVEWKGRTYDPERFMSGSPLDRALSDGNACLYGLAMSVICALGMSPGLGIVHVGHERSLAYDIADLYKHETSIPVAFEFAARAKDEWGGMVPPDFDGMVRRRMRDVFRETKLLERMVGDTLALFNDGDESDGRDVLYLWDLKGLVDAGVQYREIRA